jgi:osmotically-inducible protein OsmY
LILRLAARMATISSLPLVTALTQSACVPAVVGTGVGGTAAVATDRRTAGTQLDDGVIEDNSSLAIAERFKGDFHVNVTSFDGVVLLTGEVPADSAKADIEKLVRSNPKVRAVQNELVVGPVPDISSRSNDTLITSKVKARFVEAAKFQINFVKVVTDNGTVYLMGIVRREEGDAAAEIARTTDGVRRVVKVFEYIN